MHFLELDPATHGLTVRAGSRTPHPCVAPGATDQHRWSVPTPPGEVVIDLGGVGKGYAVDRAVEILRDWSIESALLSAGQSTVYALGEPRLAASPPCDGQNLIDNSGSGRHGQAELVRGTPVRRWPLGHDPDSPGWPVAIRNPQADAVPLGVVQLKDRAFSGSGTVIHGPHILDPRTGQPAVGTAGAWALCESAALSDALSTAFMVLTPEEVRGYCSGHAGVVGMIYRVGGQEPELLRFGDER